MKYYTPDLLAGFGSENLEEARAAQRELEKRADAYVAHFDKIKAKLPPRFLELQQSFYLHDARIVYPFGPDAPFFPGLWPLHYWLKPDVPFGEKVPTLWMIAQLDTPPQPFVVFHYRKVHTQAIRRSSTGYGEPCPYLEWGYDEVNVLKDPDGVRFSHSILFTDGLELEIVFEDFDFATLKPFSDGKSRRDGESVHAR
jgi:hypothetical protein